MAVIRDPMPAFELFQPTSVADAQMVLRRYGATAWVLAGGLDSLDWLKDRIKRPEAVVDLCGIPELKGIRETGEALEIGATTTLTEVVRHPVVRERYSILLEAAEAAASPQIAIRALSAATSRRTRCWYLPCRLALLPRRRQHLLRRYARIDQPRARDPRRRPLRGGQPV